LSVTPTDDALIVALDFEALNGVYKRIRSWFHSIPRYRISFCSAITSHLVGISADYFSRSSLDVVEADKVEITHEFSHNFQKIVQQEQGANFISRLHRGKLDTIPWPAIESKEFYKLFSTLKKRLDSQKTSHTTAGEFLHTIKTLMTKLRANDWGALSQTHDRSSRQDSVLVAPDCPSYGIF